MDGPAAPSRSLIEKIYTPANGADPAAAIDLKTISKLPNSTTFSRQDVVETLQRHYGMRLAKEVIASWDPLDERVSVHTITKLLVGIAAKVKREDLVALFEQIRFGTNQEATCVHWLTEEEKQEIVRANDFEQLNDQQLTLLMNLYRNVFNEFGDSEPVAKAFFPHYEISVTTPFEQCLDVVRACEIVDRYEQTAKLGDETFELRQKLAGAEHLAREISYVLPDDPIGLVVPIRDSEGDTKLYTVKGTVIEKGLYFYVFVPVTKGQWQKEAALCPVHCSFRGSADRHAWVRNLTESNPQAIEAGRLSYRLHEPKIAKCYAESLPLYPSKVLFTGHSLGTGDAVRLAVTHYANLANPEYAAILNRVQDMTIVTWCPVSLARETIDQYERVKGLSTLVPRIYHNYADEDIVPGASGLYLFGFQNIAPSAQEGQQQTTFMTKYTLRQISTSVGTTWVAHRTPFLIDNAEGVTIKIIPPEDLNRKLGPRGAMLWCVCAAKGFGKNAWRFFPGTATVIKGTYRLLFPLKPNQERFEPITPESFQFLQPPESRGESGGELPIAPDQLPIESKELPETEDGFVLLGE